MNETYLLFVTRNYPPQVGGMEKYSYDLYNSLKDEIKVDLLSNSKGKLYLPYFFIKCILYILLYRGKYSHIHFGDAVLSPLASICKTFTKSKISITVHALDVIYKNALYQLIIRKCLNKADKIVAVSHYTLNQCLLRGVNKDQCIFIPNGIDFSKVSNVRIDFNVVMANYGINHDNKKILFSIGRLIKRKGINWFIENVIPKLGDDYIYIIAGVGPEYQSIQDSIQKNKLEGKVYLIGKISDDEKYCIYQNSFLYIMPNICVSGDAEGFGITIIEAASFGLPTIASNIEGISDAIENDVTGKLVNQGDEHQYLHTIKHVEFDREQIIPRVKERYDWEVIKRKYIAQLFS